jgi:hypothetical protein
VLIDPDDPSTEPRALVYLEHAVHDGRSDRPISQRFQFVEITRKGETIDPGPEPYLLYRAATPDERQTLAAVMGQEWLARSLNDTARSYAVANLAGPHHQEVRDLTLSRVERVRKAVEERLSSEIRFWDAKAAELKSKELQGKKAKGGITSGHARARADEMEARRIRRLRQLDQEQDVSSRPPIVVAGALVVPQGFLGIRLPEEDKREWLDQRAVEAVMRAEIEAGRLPTEMVHHNPGYDIMSVDPKTGIHYFIEVKGRIEGMETVTVKTRQIRMGINNPDRFRLALARVPKDELLSAEVRYWLGPLPGAEPGFAEVSRTFDLDLLWDSGIDPVVHQQS